MALPDGPGPALQRYALDEIGAAVDALDAFGGRLHAGVHRSRKAMRRTRAAMALGVDALGPGARLVNRALRKTNRALSDLRDAHALVETLDRLLERAGDEDARVHLHRARHAASAHRDTVYGDTATLRHVAEVRAMLRTLHAALEGIPWEAIGTEAIDVALAMSARRIDDARAQVDATDTDADWHRWRRRLRRLSQQHRALEAAGFPLDVDAFDKSVAEQLGALQDLQLLRDYCGSNSPFDKQDRKAWKAFADHALQTQRRRLRSAGIDHAPAQNPPFHQSAWMAATTADINTTNLSDPATASRNLRRDSATNSSDAQTHNPPLR